MNQEKSSRFYYAGIKTSLNLLSDNLHYKNFKALSTGIGLGEVRGALDQEEHNVTRIKYMDTPASQKQELIEEPSKPIFIVRIMNFMQRSIKFFTAHMIDLTIVIACSIISLFLGSLIFEPTKNIKNIDSFLSWAPFQFFLNLSLIQFFIIIYMLFIAYFIIVKLLVGKTLGRTIMGEKSYFYSQYHSD